MFTKLSRQNRLEFAVWKPFHAEQRKEYIMLIFFEPQMNWGQVLCDNKQLE